MGPKHQEAPVFIGPQSALASTNTPIVEPVWSLQIQAFTATAHVLGTGIFDEAGNPSSGFSPQPSPVSHVTFPSAAIKLNASICSFWILLTPHPLFGSFSKVHSSRCHRPPTPLTHLFSRSVLLKSPKVNLCLARKFGFWPRNINHL